MTPQSKMRGFDRPEFDVATLDHLQLSEIEYYHLGLHGGLFMVNITVDEIQRDPSKYLLQVAAGEIFLILQADKAIAELRPINNSKKLRPFGLCARE
jgi:hypothetical protein